MVVALVMGNTIGSGIFLLPASLAPYGGLSLVGWGISTAGALLLAGVFARLSRLDPAAGGPYAYTRRAFGDLPAFLVTWGYWISMWTSLAALSVAGVGYASTALPALTRTPAVSAVTAVSLVWIFVAINAAGVRAAGWVQIVTTVLKIVPLALVGIVGVTHFEPSHFSLPPGSPREIAASIPAVVTLTLWALVGLECATVPARSIEDPDRTIPRATVIGTLLTAIIYIVSTVGVMSLMAPPALGASNAPFADAARARLGNTGAAVVALGAAVSCLGALNGWVLVVAQLPLAVARDGLFPRVFARVTADGTPVAGMIIAGTLTTVLVSLNYSRGLVNLFTFFILLSTLNTLIPYVFSCLAVFVIPGQPRGVRLSRGMGAVAALAFAYAFWAIAGAGQETVYWGFLLLTAGLPVYVLITRRRAELAG